MASRVPAVHKRPTLDTQENRFIKHALEDFHRFLAAAQRVFEGAGRDWSAAAALSTRLSASLEYWLARDVFSEVGELVSVPLGSPVLHRKAGYREVLRWWLRFRTASELSWSGAEDAFRAGQRNVAELYEYWLFFVLLEWFWNRFEGKKSAFVISELVDGLDGDQPNIRVRARVPLGPFTGTFSEPRRRVHASFTYNQEFKFSSVRQESGSWTRGMHPDYTLTFWPAIAGKTVEEARRLAEEQELLVHVHLDAKYRVESLSALLGDRDAPHVDEEEDDTVGNYKRQDLLKMHAYRDAIKRSEGAYVLYPGSEADRLKQHRPDLRGPGRWPSTMWAYHEILPSLGAFAIAPDDEGNALGLDHLSMFIDELLENLCNRTSFREGRAAYLHEALRQHQSFATAGDGDEIGGLILQDAPELDADSFRREIAEETIVLIVSTGQQDEATWMERNGRVAVALGPRSEMLPLIKALSNASHVLLSGPVDLTVSGLLRIKPLVGEVWQRDELEAINYPAGRGLSSDLFAVFAVVPDSAFESLKWSVARLERATARFLARQRPTFKKQMNQLWEKTNAVRLVSLADLQVALDSDS